MANNPYVNKVKLADGTTLMDISEDTVTAGNMIKGTTAHDRSGASIVGTYDPTLIIDDTAGAGDTDKTWSADKLTDELASRAAESSVLNLTAAAGAWTSATPPTQTISATGVTASNNIIVGIGSGATSEQLDAAAAAKILCTAQGTNSITLTCYGTEPSVNIPLTVLILG